MKKKKSLKIIAAVLAVVLVVGGIIAYSMLPHPLNYKIKAIESVGSEVEVVAEGEDFVSVKKTSDGEFKVLMFTDIHLDGKNKTSNITVENLVRNIQSEKPDLVILGGDNVTSGLNKKRANQLAEIFEKLGVYWAGILGNHEGDNNLSVSREKMIDIFASYDHCLMRQGKNDVDGNGNYVLNILNPDSSIRKSFFFLDTMDEMTDVQKETYGLSVDEDYYDGVKESQVKWYSDTVEKMKKESGNFSSIAVLHIPLVQYKTAFEDGAELLYGAKRENICASGFDSGLFAAIKKSGSTDTVFCGHDHLNNFGLVYDGILLSYIQPSGYGSYTAASKLGYEEKDWLQGYTKLILNKDGTFSQEQFRNSETNK